MLLIDSDPKHLFLMLRLIFEETTFRFHKKKLKLISFDCHDLCLPLFFQIEITAVQVLEGKFNI